MDQTINDRAQNLGAYEERKGGDGGEEDWIEIRLAGKLPERRSNHAAFIMSQKDQEYLYIHGGRDLKEGSIDTMWRVSLTGIHALQQDPFYPVEWECVTTTGRSPGKISHHTCSMMKGNKEVIFYGGLKGDDSNAEIFIYNALGSSWTTVHLSPQATVEPRDDHAMCDKGDGNFMVFGGFVNGSRVDDVVSFEPQAVNVNATLLAGGSTGNCGPVVRASHSSVVYGDKLYVFGGQDDDNNKMGDLWTYDLGASRWAEIAPAEGGFQPIARSGHTAVVWGQKMYIFGGILELTKELNDMVVFDFASGLFVAGDNANDAQSPAPVMTKGANDSQYQGEASPARTQKGAGSPVKRRTLAGTASPTLKPKGKLLASPSKKERAETGGEKQDGLSSPTSISMQNTFLIKNADHSFDAYYQQMRKRKAGHFGASHADHNVTGHGESAKFGLINGQRPTARDGHCGVVDSLGFMYVFGGDRHLMPFNDLYMIKLQ